MKVETKLPLFMIVSSTPFFLLSECLVSPKKSHKTKIYISYCLTYPISPIHFFLQAEKLDVMLEKRKEPLNSVVEFAIGEELRGNNAYLHTWS